MKNVRQFVKCYRGIEKRDTLAETDFQITTLHLRFRSRHTIYHFVWLSFPLFPLFLFIKEK